jgi:chromosome segregation protein
MEQLQSARQKIIGLLGDVKDVEDAVVRAERHHNDKCYAVAYFDLADNVVGRAKELHDFQERILGNDFFGTPGDLRWNKYLYIVAGPKSLDQDGFEKAKVAIESDKDYARKRVVSEEELETVLGAAKHFTPSNAGKDFNVIAEWEKRLAAADLDELLDRPTRKDVLERIGTHSAKRVLVVDKALTLNPTDTSLAKEWLSYISIERFRPIHDGKSYGFGQVNLVVGPNGTGKTSLLEAIEYFYCGHNRRQGNPGTPKISGTLANGVPMQSSSEVARIRARCFSWYNRDERYAKSILGAFTRYNFLDTDAAYRLSTELEPSEIPDDLSRLLVGADASTIWDYLTKIAPEVEIARDRAAVRIDEIRLKLEQAQKELRELQERPSNGKSLTDAFRASLGALKWKAPRGTTPLVTATEAMGLQEALGHIQALLATGSAAVSLDAISARERELGLAVAQAHPLDEDSKRYAQEAKQLAEQALSSERASQNLDRWLTYVNTGFSATYARLTKAKAAVDLAQGHVGVYANGDIPEVPGDYVSIPLESALQGANVNVQNAAARVADLERLSAQFGKAASARAQAARQLRAAAQASFDAGHPKDDCPICRAKYLPQDLASLVDRITSALDEPSELVEISGQLTEARTNLERLQSWVAYFQYLQQVANAIHVAPDSVCGAIPVRLVELRAELAKANADLTAANKEWERLANSGLTTNEHDSLRKVIVNMLSSPEAALDAAAVREVRDKMIAAAAVIRGQEAQTLELFNRVTGQLAAISAAVTIGDWNTRARENGGMESLVILKNEMASVQNQASALRSFMDLDSRTPLAELSVAVVGATRIHSEALQSVKTESLASESISMLTQRVEQLSGQLNRASDQAKNYQVAKGTLDLLRKECSLERATQESLDGISAQINEIFSRIHAPNEYEYIGRGEVLLQTAVSHEKRLLEQVSTGQRAAFALSVFLAMNRSATSAPPVILIDDPIAHIDDLNALSFLDYLRDLAVNSNRQIFFATADTRIASLFTRKFGFLAESFKTIQLARES